MKRSIYINRSLSTRRAVIVEERHVVEALHEDVSNEQIVGNVYKGRVERVLPGMQAAFVDIGGEKNGFLYRDELLSFQIDPDPEKEKSEKSISIYVQQGEEVLVQVTKEARGEKGPRLTGVIALPGRYAVYMPTAGYVAISKRMSNEQIREFWRAEAKKIVEKEEGLIIRTSAESAQVEQIKQDIHISRTLWQRKRKEAKEQKVPSLVYSAQSLLEELVGSFADGDIDEWIVDHLEDYMLLKDLLRETPAFRALSLYRASENLFVHKQVEHELEKALRRRIWMKNGAFLVFDETEALSVIDVNTGKFTGSQNLRDTVLRTNHLAAKEIARQIRLRNMSGMILIDFIDMKQEEDQRKVQQALEAGLKRDRVHTNVRGFTKLGLLEMTRKKVRLPLNMALSKPCPMCAMKGTVKSNKEQAYSLERSLWEHMDSEVEAVVLEVHPDVWQTLLVEADQSIDGALGFQIFTKLNASMPWTIPYAFRYIGSRQEAEGVYSRISGEHP
ncbi:Rne/Rng family ribonuclease [Shouchella shacheensis]|uniref:Rne/Rng family ribonuclease n=1 Tax=Shouchella shacheensis TaxID=1649580 RepID=UPI00074041F8|nr:Rne/Rng family ribonuclease [Shouchella shacheensis]